MSLISTLVAGALPVLLTETVQLTLPPALCTLGVLVTTRMGLLGVIDLLLVTGGRAFPHESRKLNVTTLLEVATAEQQSGQFCSENSMVMDSPCKILSTLAADQVRVFAAWL